MLDLGAVYAINMDGGGSSTMVMPSRPREEIPRSNHYYHSGSSSVAGTTTTATSGIDGDRKYAAINRPTCLDLPLPHCQRAVATVLCVSTNGTEENF